MSSFRSAVAAGLLLLAASAGTGRAQPAAPTSPAATETFLEQRVVEELAADGIVLSRLGVVLELQLVEGRAAVVSLIDPGTSRAVASTKIDVVPTDRDIAVATLTPVVANLVAQYAGPRPATSDEQARLSRIEATQRELLATAAAERQEKARLEKAELEYREQALRFEREVVVDATYDASLTTSVETRWTARRGETAEPLEGDTFYKVVERPDLARAYHRRRANGGTLLAGGLVVGTASAILLVHETGKADEDPSRGPTGTFMLGVGGFALSSLGVIVGIRWLRNPHPIEDAEARRIGAEYNRKLRRRLGLPVPSPVPELVGVRWDPYVIPDGGGLAISGRF